MIGATGNREYTVYSIRYWTLSTFYEKSVRIPHMVAKLFYVFFAGQHFEFIMIKSSCIMKQKSHLKIETARNSLRKHMFEVS